MKHLIFFALFLAVAALLGTQIMDGATGGILMVAIIAIWMGPLRLITLVIGLVMMIAALDQ